MRLSSSAAARLGVGTLLLLLSHVGFGQIMKQKHLELIQARSASWNKAFNSRDTTALGGLLHPGFTLNTATGSQTTAASVRLSFRQLFRQRPDITWMNRSLATEISDLGNVAYETGEWAEAWTDPQSKTKNRIIGKYWLMWKYENNAWQMFSAIYTPMNCSGNACR
ncbi:nuclear transport factor 2 family protein [Hymenobacter persicinus]|uniref:Nuclear transport factor 2 family protein n=1 Tax=Hymenobacter persicinus TaxID=2025506 RepID=A0A4Q5LI11_9BACT|nr:nuclear transport factor 2 family protein [Hymenobacter persicinus]RYU82167.1 nuclear transport factor 2 family protein [Hymenobacter persicinus]